MRLTESDLRFVVETVTTRRRDHEHIIELVRDKEELLEAMLEDTKLTERLVNEEEMLVRVSPYLMFAVLLRRVRRDLEGRQFMLERDERGRRIPIFEAAQAAQLLSDPVAREYLVEMLCSFVRTDISLLCWRERGIWRKRKFSDLDIDDMIALCQLVEPTFKPRLYKRIADIALFLTGVYPDHGPFFTRRSWSRAGRGRAVTDYERDGQRFYTLAAREPTPPWSASIFQDLAQKFTLARETLNALNDSYLKALRARYFDQPPSQS